MTPIRWTYAFVDRPAARLAEARAFWTAVTGTSPSPARGERREFVTLLPDGADPCVKMQGALDGPGGAHLDFFVEDVAEFVRTARGLGAGRVADHRAWAVLRSPGGQAFCVGAWQGETVRPPVVDGCRLDQVCLDVPPSVYDAETAFWAALTGWDLLSGSLPEFRVLRPPAGLPLRVLLQRLGAEGPASAHPDLACADVESARARHERLGAAFVRRGTHWTVMRDPAGGTYCLTGRDPETGGLPVPPG